MMFESELAKALWVFFNSAPGVAMMGVVVAAIMKRIFMKRPDWWAWEGTIIAAIKYAEKAIDPTKDPKVKSLAKLDTALQYILRVYEEQKGITSYQTPESVINDFKEGIQITQQEMEVEGTLPSLSGKAPRIRG